MKSVSRMHTDKVTIRNTPNGGNYDHGKECQTYHYVRGETGTVFLLHLFAMLEELSGNENFKAMLVTNRLMQCHESPWKSTLKTRIPAMTNADTCPLHSVSAVFPPAAN
jgi:hypothetical protein